jgi:methionyl-tRNA formyltransferase
MTRLIFIATGDIALPAFRHLLANGPLPLALVTQPDKPVGRHQTLTSPAIKLEALAAGIPVYQPEKIGDIAADLALLEPEILVVMAYGQILRADILALASKAIINLHASLLPKYRGAACIQAAIDAGDVETGITAMHVVKELDAGDVIVAHALAIHPDETGGSLHDRLADLAPAVLAEALEKLTDGSVTRTPQDAAASTYISKLGREDGRLDWSQDAVVLERRIRAYHPWPGTYAIAQEKGKEKRVKIFPPVQVIASDLKAGQVATVDSQLVIGCGCGALVLGGIQVEGSRAMQASEYLCGRQPEAFA